MNKTKMIVLAAFVAGVWMTPMLPGATEAVTPGPTEKSPKPYPLSTCLVSGEKFGGDMGKPVVIVYEGREIKFCCKSCIGKFKKDSATYLKKLEQAEKASSPST